MERDETLHTDGVQIRPLPDGSDIRKVTATDLPQVVEALARSFYDDPVFSWIIPNDDQRLGKLRRGFDLFARRVWLPKDEAYTTEDVIGAAFWMPPGTWHQSLFEQLRMLPAIAMITGRDLSRLLRILNALEAKHPHDSHYYLPLVGIGPEWQGRGFGSALLRGVLERCDRQNVGAYLEASSPRNRALYERHDFTVTEELSLKGSPPLWLMWRKPHPRSP